jgi:ribosomal RNA assembly protein
MLITPNSDEIRAELKIPRERIAILIGKKGIMKRKLEKATNTKIEVDSKEGDVFIYGEDGLKIFETREVVKAVGRGFNPQTAMKLLDMDYTFDVVRMGDFAPTKNSELRLKGRVIGKEGRTRALIEQMTEAYVSVYGKTIAIIGKPESMIIAKRAVIMLLQGSQHSNVYSWLEKKRKTLKYQEDYWENGEENS